MPLMETFIRRGYYCLLQNDYDAILDRVMSQGVFVRQDMVNNLFSLEDMCYLYIVHGGI